MIAPTTARKHSTDPMHHQGLVRSIAVRYRGKGLEIDDLISEGQIGLLRAAQKYDPSRGVKFGTYATWWIRQAIDRGIQERGWMITIPHDLYRKLRPDDEASLPAGKRRRLEAARRIAGARVLDIQDPEDPRRGEIVAAVDPGAGRFELSEDVVSLLGRLPERSRRVLELRFGLGGEPPLPLWQIGERLGLCTERIRQIEAEALGVIRVALAGHDKEAAS